MKPKTNPENFDDGVTQVFEDKGLKEIQKKSKELEKCCKDENYRNQQKIIKEVLEFINFYLKLAFYLKRCYTYIVIVFYMENFDAIKG